MFAISQRASLRMTLDAPLDTCDRHGAARSPDDLPRRGPSLVQLFASTEE
jgi:hypothetical protein